MHAKFTLDFVMNNDRQLCAKSQRIIVCCTKPASAENKAFKGQSWSKKGVRDTIIDQKRAQQDEPGKSKRDGVQGLAAPVGFHQSPSGAVLGDERAGNQQLRDITRKPGPTGQREEQRPAVSTKVFVLRLQ